MLNSLSFYVSVIIMTWEREQRQQEKNLLITRGLGPEVKMPLAIGDSWVQHAIKLVRNQKYRSKQRKTIISSPKIISELPQSLAVHNIALTPEFCNNSDKYNKYPEISKYWNKFGRKEISRDIIRVITREASPEGVIAEIGTPAIKTEKDPISQHGPVLFLYKISDPGNLGTLIRTAKAFGWDTVVLIDDCVDPFNSECIRSSMGASLKSSIHRYSSDQLAKVLRGNEMQLFIADKKPSGIKTDTSRSIPSRQIGLVLGSEANGFAGFPQCIRDKCSIISINISSEVESLNVAVCGGILMKDLIERNK